MKKLIFMILAVFLVLTCCAAAWAEEMGAALPDVFFTWDMLGTYAGAAALVALVTQLTKNLPYIAKVPTQVWSYVLAVLVLIASQIFTGTLSASSAALSLANGVLVSLASNGGYSLITRVSKAVATEEEEVDVEITNWPLSQLKAFCVFNEIPTEGCETREDYIDAIAKHFG